MKSIKYLRVVFGVLLCVTSALARKTEVVKDINYVDTAAAEYSNDEHKLDIYLPKGNRDKAKVLIFIHGGAWKKGSKDTPRHTAVGKAFSFQGFIAVVINYRLAPGTKYYDMAKDCARAVVWVEKNIVQYGGDVSQISLAGHSSGAHLAALITTDSSYLIDVGFKNHIKACVLNDAFGLNMLNYLGSGNPVDVMLFHNTFTDLPSEWQKASPYYHIDKDGVLYYVLYGGQTMEVVIDGSIQFYDRNRYVGNVSHMHKVKWRAHIPMLNLFCNKRNKELKKVVAFISQK